MMTYFGYKFVQEIPLTRLKEFKEHRRLRVFYHKGCICVNCNIVGTKLIQGSGRGGLHWDIYADCGMALTVDHKIPKSKGGSDDLSNLQPMCAKCNTEKGNGETNYSKINSCIGHFCQWPRNKPGGGVKKEDLIKTVVLKEGMEVWRKKHQNKVKYTGIISKIVINPHTKELNYMVEGNKTSMYNFHKTYIKKSP